MFRRAPAFCIIFLLVMVSTGCAVGVSHTPFKQDPNAPVRSIAVVNVPNPVMTTIHNWGSIAGGIGAANSQSKYREPLTNLLTTENFDFAKEMRVAIVDRLQLAGYQVTSLNVVREDSGKLLDDYSKLPNAGADAILDLATGVYFGYANVSILDNRFRPNIVMRARLVSSKTRQPLYAEEIMYGWTNFFMKATDLPAPEKYYYDEADLVIANRRNTVEGLRAGVKSIADHLVAQLQL